MSFQSAWHIEGINILITLMHTSPTHDSSIVCPTPAHPPTHPTSFLASLSGPAANRAWTFLRSPFMLALMRPRGPACDMVWH